MLDAGFIRENLAAVITNCKNRFAHGAEPEKVVALDDERKKLVHELQLVQQRANETSKLIPKEKDATKKQELIAEGRKLREETTTLEANLKEVETALRHALMTIPNMTHPDVPVGKTGDDNPVVKTFLEPKTFPFKAKDHVDLVETLELADMEAGARVAGNKFYFLKNEGALLELALVQYAISKLVAKDFIPIITPDLARVEVMEGTGYMPRDPNPENRQFYTIADSDLCLIATAEITLGGMHRDHIFDEAQLPMKYVGLSHCFRTEAGAAGRDTRGLYRVHQFTKVEMFAYCTPETSNALHEELRQAEEEIFQGLGLPYQVIDTCSGDLGGPAYRKYDLEAWMPGRGDAGQYGEVTSTSNCTDFQARRLNIRYRPKESKGTKFVHTLNGTAIAVTRALIAILENYQQEDGTVIIPEALRPWIGKEKIEMKK